VLIRHQPAIRYLHQRLAESRFLYSGLAATVYEGLVAVLVSDGDCAIVEYPDRGLARDGLSRREYLKKPGNCGSDGLLTFNPQRGSRRSQHRIVRPHGHVAVDIALSERV
jgi:hypothetical protein